jgi:glyoxylase-like metal-dependent hydrolase (beta-lactamase superfamily II)
MKRRFVSCVVVLILFAGCVSNTPEQQFVDATADALGGRDRVLAVGVVVMEGTGTAPNLGQDMTWEAANQAFTLSDVRRVLDLSGPRARVEQTRTPNFLYFQGSQAVRQVSGFDGEVAYSIAANGNANRQGAAAARERRIDFYHHPLTIVYAMIGSPQSVRNVQAGAEGRQAEFSVGDITFNLRLRSNGELERVSSPGYHPNLGDVTVTTTFDDYQDAGGLRLPRRFVTRSDRWTTSEMTIAAYAFDASSDVAAPASVATALPTPATPNVVATSVAPGVWLLAGQSHHSALVEFADHLTLIEAPQSEARTLAVIAKARELVPAKPLTELVMSHHHFDHSGGLRAAISEGLAVITHKGNAAFVEEMAKRPHTRQPDSLSRAPRPLTVTSVDRELTVQDAGMTMVLYPISGNPHGDTMLMAYLPRERVLIQADAFSPGGTYHPYAANLLEIIRSRRLAVDRIVPLHGTIVTLDDLTKAVEAQ